MEQAYVHDLNPHLVSFTREHKNRWIHEYRHEQSIRKMWEKRWSSMQQAAEWERFESIGSLIPLVKMLKWDVQKLVIEDQEKYMQEKSTISVKRLP